MRRSLWNMFIDWVAERITVEIDPALTEAFGSSPSGEAQPGSELSSHIIYLSRRPSAMHTALLCRVLLRAGLPVPQDTLRLAGDGHLRRSRYPRILTRSFLRPRRGSEAIRTPRGRHRSRLQHFLDDISQFDRRRRIALIPFAVFTGRGARLIHKDSIAFFDFDYFPTLDLIRVVLFALFRDQVQVRLGAPIPIARNEAAGTLRKVSRRIYGWEKLVQAARSPSHETLARVVLSGRRFEKVARDISLQEGASLFQIQARAERILYGMAARFHSLIIGVLYLLLRRVLPRMFKIRIVGLEKLERQIGETPVVVIPSHRSHADYIILSYLFFTGGLPLPHVAAGDNLNFWPVGRLLRAGGAFFIRRKIDRDDRLYKTILDLYLTMLMKQGSVIEFFIEGGRSRSGATLPPRYGLLKYLVRAYLLGQREDLAFVPVSITYDRLLEERALLGEQAGARKESESVFQLFRLVPGLRRSFGGVTIVVEEPITMRSLHVGRGRAGEEESEGLSTNELTVNLGSEISVKIQSGTALSPRSLLSIVLADLDRRGPGDPLPDSQRIGKRIEDLFFLFSGTERPERDRLADSDPAGAAKVIAALPFHLSQSTTEALQAASWAGVAENLASGLSKEGIDICVFESEQRIFRAIEGSALRRDYYRNTMIHHLIGPLFYLLLGQPGVVSNSGKGGPAQFQHTAVEKLHRLFTPVALLPDWPSWTQTFKAAGLRLESQGVIEFLSRPGLPSSLGSWRVTVQGWATYGYLLAGVRPLLEAVQSALAVSTGLPEDGLEDDKFNWRVRNGAVQTVTTSMLGWAREFLTAEGVLQKVVMDRDTAGSRKLGVVASERGEGQALFQLLRLMLSPPREASSD